MSLQMRNAHVCFRHKGNPEAVGDAVPLSVDTFRASVAEECVRTGADIVNDISGGDLDLEMFNTVARLGVPYILMHTRSNPADMQRHTDYEDVTAEVLRDLAFKIDRLRQLGVTDIIADPVSDSPRRSIRIMS